jgi:tetratricopeptide (TPR) repeat protein
MKKYWFSLLLPWSVLAAPLPAFEPTGEQSPDLEDILKAREAKARESATKNTPKKTAQAPATPHVAPSADESKMESQDSPLAPEHSESEEGSEVGVEAARQEPKPLAKPAHNFRVRIQRIYQLYRDQEWRNVRKDIAQLGKTYALDSSLKFMDGYAAWKLGERNEALKVFDRVYRDGYRHVNFLRAYMQALYQAERYGLAKEVGEALAARVPDDLGAHFNLGLIEAQRKNFDRARVHLEAAKQISPKNPDIYKALVYVDRKLNDAPGAIQNYKQWLWVSADVNLAREYLEFLASQGTDGERGQRFYDEAHEWVLQFPQDDAMNRLMAKACRAVGKEELARHFESAKR